MKTEGLHMHTPTETALILETATGEAVDSDEWIVQAYIQKDSQWGVHIIDALRRAAVLCIPTSHVSQTQTIGMH